MGYLLYSLNGNTELLRKWFEGNEQNGYHEQEKMLSKTVTVYMQRLQIQRARLRIKYTNDTVSHCGQRRETYSLSTT